MRRVLFDSIQTAHAASPYFIAEDGVGIWLGTDDASRLAAGRSFEVVRDALHVPSVRRTGEPVSLAVRAEALGLAERMGLRQRHAATGYWTLSDTGELQTESVIIVFSENPVDRQRLEALATWLLRAADQDAVAIEIAGVVMHVRG